MTSAINAQAPAEQRRCPYFPVSNNPISNALGYGLIGALAHIPFFGGAIFGLTAFGTDRALNWVFAKADISQNNTIANVMKFALRFFTNTIVGMLVLNALGIPLTIGGALLFSAGAYLVVPCFLSCLMYPFLTLANIVNAES
jgi:hypothetical protein